MSNFLSNLLSRDPGVRVRATAFDLPDPKGQMWHIVMTDDGVWTGSSSAYPGTSFSDSTLPGLQAKIASHVARMEGAPPIGGASSTPPVFGPIATPAPAPAPSGPSTGAILIGGAVVLGILYAISRPTTRTTTVTARRR